MKDTSVVTPVGLIAVLFALIAGYQTITRGPAFFVAAIALVTYVAIRMIAVRTGRTIMDARAANLASTDPWARASRRDRRLQKRSLGMNLALTELTGLFPSTSMRARGICGKLGYA